MESPNETAGGAQKTSAGKGDKNMKRCSHCGAKNKDTFEYCVRCSEPLDDDGGAWVEPSERRSPMMTLAAAGIFGILGLMFIATVNSLFDEDPAIPTATRRATPPPAPPAERRGEPILVNIDSQALLDLYNEGRAAFSQGDYDTAIDKLSDVVQDLPDNPSAMQILGLAYYHRGDLEDSIRVLEEARTLLPDSFQLLDHYVTACKKAEDIDGALAALSDFVSEHPYELDVRLELARLARASGNDEIAMAQSEYLATEDDLDPEFIYEYGVTLKESGQLDEAIAVLSNSVELDPESAVAHHALGATQLQKGNASRAVGSLEEAVAREPGNGDFRFSLAQAYEKLDRIQESLDAYEAYLEHASPGDRRADVVKRQLPLARKALAEEEKAKRGQSL